ncbi:MAG: hypothetical protein Q9201_006979 [Fulgogasparrea decipioides]
MSSLPSYQSDLVARTRKLLEAARSVPLSAVQQTTLIDPDVKGPSWVSRTSFPAPKDESTGPQSLLGRAIEALGGGRGQCTMPPVETVDARWTGHRPGVEEEEPEPAISEHEKYRALIKNLKLCYLSLLHPPPGAFHDPVPASSVVFSGDSAGANLALALTQVLLFARSTTLLFHSTEVSLPLPAGIAVLSAGLDLTLALPSWRSNAPFDIFSDSWSFLAPGYPTCKIWPSDPPRGHPYCEIGMMLHPLVAPAFARSWEGAPPMWFAGGQERFADSAKLAAEQAARQGVPVSYEEYEEMPHDFPIMSATWPWAKTEGWPQSVKCMEAWVNACKVFGEGGTLRTGAVVILSQGGEQEKDVSRLTVGAEKITLLAQEKQAGWKIFTGQQKAIPSL